MQYDKKGFTLIELLVIISITVLMTIAIFANYGKGNDSFALERAGQKLSQDLRRTQEMAMSGFEGETSANGYGIYFDKGSSGQYVIYLNKGSMYYEVGTDVIKDTVKIETGIVICNILDNGVAPSPNPNIISVSFEPPDPRTYIENNYSGHEATIILCLPKKPTETRIIKVNSMGRIEVTKS